MYDYQITRQLADARHQDLTAYARTYRLSRAGRATTARPERRGLFGLAIRRGGHVALAR